MQAQIVGLVTPLMAIVFMTTFLLLWKQGGMGRYVLGFAGAYLFFALGFAATHLLDTSSFYVFHVTQLFYTGGTFCIVWAVCKRVGQDVSLPSLCLTYAIAAGVLAVCVYATADVAPRLYAVNTGYGVMFAIGSLTLLRAPRREVFDRLVILMMVLSAINFFTRPVLTLLVERSFDASVYRETIYYSVLNLALTIMALVTAMTLIGASVSDLMRSVKERGDRDPLTGLRNRRSFETDIRALAERARREGVSMSLVVADIDNFKQVNDVFGHQAGDLAIANFGRLISNMVRDCDLSGRIGGEEFCIVVWNCDLGAASRLAERIRFQFASERQEGVSEGIRLTASFGVAEWQGDERYAKVFARADAALYRAKETGRNRVLNEQSPELTPEVVQTASPQEGVANAA